MKCVSTVYMYIAPICKCALVVQIKQTKESLSCMCSCSCLRQLFTSLLYLVERIVTLVKIVFKS